jgi:copper transport protein
VNISVPRVRRRGWLGLLAGALVGLALVLAPAAPASAHASLVKTDPSEGQVLAESPGEARLTFNETVSAPAGGVKMYDAQGKALESKASARDNVLTVDVPDTLDEGTYVVSWRVVSADGHPIAGSLTFSVGQASSVVRPPPEADESSASGVRGALSVVQALGYLGLFLAAGLVVFTAWLLPPLPRLDVLRRRLRRVVRVSAAVAVLAGLVQLPLGGAYQQGLGFSDLLGGSVWSGAGGRELLGLVLLTAGLSLAVAPLGVAPLLGRMRVVATAGAVLAMASPSVVGHSRAFPPQLLVVATDVLHVAAGSVWVGGLVGLALSLPALAGRSRAAAETLARFSGLAGGILTVLVAAGSVLAWRIIGSWDNLFGTTYGRLLIVKVMVAGLAVGIAAWNRFALLPRAVGATDRAERLEAANEIKRTVAAEASVLVAVLLVTGFLVNQSPRQAPAVIKPTRMGVVTGQLGEHYRVLGTMSPRAVGTNTVTIQLQDHTGEPYEPVRPPTVRVRSETVDLGDAALTPSDTGTYRAEVVLPTAGNWRVQVSLRIDEFENPVASLSFRVPASGR